MTFENYACDWLDRQTFSKSIRKTSRQSLDYIFKAIGELEIEDISSVSGGRFSWRMRHYKRTAHAAKPHTKCMKIP